MNKKKIAIYILVFDIFLLYGLIFALSIPKIHKWRVKKSEEMLTQSQKTFDAREKIFLLQQATFLNPSEQNLLMTGKELLINDNEVAAVNYFRKIDTAEGNYQLSSAYFELQKLELAEKYALKSLSSAQSAKSHFLLGKIYLKQEKLRNAVSEFSLASKMEQHPDYAKYLNVLRVVVYGDYVKEDLGSIYSSDEKLLILRIYRFLLEEGYPQSAFAYLQTLAKKNKLDRDGYLYLSKEYSGRGMLNEQYDTLILAKLADPHYPQTYEQLISVSETIGKKSEAEEYRSFLSSISW